MKLLVPVAELAALVLVQMGMGQGQQVAPLEWAYHETSQQMDWVSVAGLEAEPVVEPVVGESVAVLEQQLVVGLDPDWLGKAVAVVKCPFDMLGKFADVGTMIADMTHEIYDHMEVFLHL